MLLQLNLARCTSEYALLLNEIEIKGCLYVSYEYAVTSSRVRIHLTAGLVFIL